MAHKIKNILLWLALAVYLVMVLGFVSDRCKEVVCNKVDILISNSDVNHFLKQKDVVKTLENSKVKMIGLPCDQINTYVIEKQINKNPAVLKTAAYTNLKGELVVDVEQCRPILRIINKSLQQYFIDENGRIIPYHSQYCAYTLVANGNIKEPFEVNIGRSIFPSNRDSMPKPNIIYDLFNLATFIDGDDFWCSQIEQIYVNAKEEIELIPRVGAHTILFGKANNIEYKFKKLKSIYRTFNQIGWKPI